MQLEVGYELVDVDLVYFVLFADVLDEDIDLVTDVNFLLDEYSFLLLKQIAFTLLLQIVLLSNLQQHILLFLHQYLFFALNILFPL